MEKIKEYLLTGSIIIFAVALYMFMPGLLRFIDVGSRGIKGLVFLGAVGLILTGVYYLFGYRGWELLKIFLLILFIAAMIWLYFNYRDVDNLISSRYGQGVATFVFLVIIFLVWLLSRILI
ncbi:MAG: hypothetical protein IK026_05310 [Eubacteriaceae bacterium]|nr:hypothetical protein [Eubacteriaceae bacterium]